MKIMISFQVDTAEEAQSVIAAAAAVGKEPHACSTQYIAPGELTPVERAVEAAAEQINTAFAPAPIRPNVSPGVPSIGKIGTATKDFIFDDLRHNTQPPQPKYTEHLKLLWARGEVKYDGKEYYI